ncbi:MAG: LacI family DNA-binding transcriptional regulator [Anaerolineales bacterium]|nr:LacI family DNA-binding transcriptional regulator [Anaerolineales bacterium]
MARSMKRVTIKDVAAHAGVSYQTVSRVINNQPGVVESTRQRIEQAIVELNYRPNLAARSLPRHRSNIIGLIVPYDAVYLFRDPNLLAQISSIDAEANACGYNLLLSTAAGSDNGLDAYKRFVRNRVADGALVVETAAGAAGNQLLSQNNYFYVSLGYDLSHTRKYFVHADDRRGANEATRHLLHKGHRRIGIINGPLIGAVGATQERLTGHLEALAEANIVFDPCLMVYGDYTRPSGQKATEKLLALPDPPTAIFAFNDRMAMGAVWMLKSAGLRVPEDIAVVGFDDIPTAADFSPPLTTVRHSGVRVGQVAAQMLFKLIDGAPVESPEVVLPAELIVRQSS